MIIFYLESRKGLYWHSFKQVTHTLLNRSDLATELRTMIVPGFTSPNSTTLRKSIPFHDDMEALLGEWSSVGTPVLWCGSVLLGIVFCKLVYDISQALSPVIFPIYNKLTKSEKVEWDNRAFSTAHALISSGISFYLLYICDLFRESAPYGPIMFRGSILSQFGLGFSCGYFIADMGIMIVFYPMLGGYEFLLHHLVSTLACILGVHSGHCHFYMYIVLLSECTTPFINLRWYLTMTGLKDSDAYFYNGAFTAFLWLLARVINFLHCFYHLYSHFDQAMQVHTVGFIFLLISPTSLGMMNFFWFYKIMQAMVRTLSRKQAP